MSKDIKKIHVEFHDKMLVGLKNAARGVLDVLPKDIIFDRTTKQDIAVFTDEDLNEPLVGSAKINLAWLIESPEYKRSEYSLMQKRAQYSKFDRVYTFDKKLLSLGDRFRFLPIGGSWIIEDDWGIYPKQKNVSIIASKKDFLTGHRIRHKVIARYRNKIDGVYGRGYKPFDDKAEILNSYRYSIVIENCRSDYYFTEKIIDCFLTGVVPVYWGCPSIGDFFNKDGIIEFKRIGQLKRIFASLTAEEYQKRSEAIHDNFIRAQQYVMPEERLAVLMRNDPLIAPHLQP